MKLIALATAVAFASTGCAGLVGNDRRQEVAYQVLYSNGHPSGKFPPPADPVFTAALNAKFPSGTDVENLREFVTRLGGKCKELSATKLQCSIVDYSTICFASTLSIIGNFEEKRLKDIEVRPWSNGC